MFNPHINFEMFTVTCNEQLKGNAKCKNSRQKLKFTEKIAKSCFVPPFGGRRGNVHGSSMARRKVRGRLPISPN